MNSLDQVRLFAKCLFEPKDIVEIRCLRGKAQSLFEKAHSLAHPRLNRLNARHDMYVGANPRKDYGARSNDGVEMARCLFVDWDNTSLLVAARVTDEAELPLPTCVIWTGGGVHCYWRLQHPLYDMDLWRQLQRQLIHSLGTDRCIHDPSRVMRLPGFFNHKPGRTPSRIVYANPDWKVDINEIVAVLPKIEPAQAVNPNYLPPTDRSFLQRRAAAYLRRVPAAVSGQHGHNATFRAAAILCRFGLSEEEAMPILNEYNERCIPPWEEKDLRRKYREASKHAHLTRSPAI